MWIKTYTNSQIKVWTSSTVRANTRWSLNASRLVHSWLLFLSALECQPTCAECDMEVEARRSTNWGGQLRWHCPGAPPKSCSANRADQRSWQKIIEGAHHFFLWLPPKKTARCSVFFLRRQLRNFEVVTLVARRRMYFRVFWVIFWVHLFSPKQGVSVYINCICCDM